MKKSFQQRWVAALRSGEYKQATGALRTPDGFCCLGVACDLTDSTKWGPGAPLRIANRIDHMMEDITGFAWGETPPDSLAWLDQKLDLHHSQVGELANMNDQGVPFDKIAARIESFDADAD